MVVLFVVAVVLIVVAVDAVVFLVFGLNKQPADVVLTMVGGASAIALLAIGITSLFRTMSLRKGGGGAVARQLGGIVVPENTPDPRLRRLRNVVEEMAIASGMPVPEVYVLPQEEGINAFAAGFSPADAAVAVTHGALERLNRDELQGVIAHEFSHVVNGDMRLNIRLIGVLFGILVLAVVGRLLLSVRGRTPLPLVGIALMILGYVGVFFGRLIKAAVSRQREYLADASAVQFTRQTAGLTGALKKIGGLQTGSALRSKRTEDVSHMLFGEGGRFARMFATHPPLEERIRTLDPTFDPTQLQQLSQQWAHQLPHGMSEDQAMGLAPPAPLPRAQAAQPMPAAQVVAAVGGAATPASPAHRRAESILDAIPGPVLARARDQRTVLPLVFGLLLSRDEAVRAGQLPVLAARFGPGLADAARQESDTFASLHPVLRLPLAGLAFPMLRRRGRPEQEAVLACMHAMNQADGRIEVFEYCLSRLLHRDLYESMHRQPPWRVTAGRRQPAEQKHGAIAGLLAILAGAGNPDPAAAAAAYQAGLAKAVPGATLPYALPPAGPVALEPLWPVLDNLDGPEKEWLITGMVTVIAHDERMTVAEIELLRTVCAVLHCPLPPLAESQPDKVAP